MSEAVVTLLSAIADRLGWLALLNQGMNDNLAPIQKLVWV
ncbi:hypothetical protein MICAC_4500003 [Microcystis aeruginosa PCC 9443]|uniref:Uncharacterized protein n=1 Tax=Microcystis aeruginosa PCC 9443 TaxID=1160281 RepID=I4G601_MICAE|nr:hypothetical protein MICAC_4500003 [Microcystis aeruginosa PCC 9443]